MALNSKELTEDQLIKLIRKEQENNVFQFIKAWPVQAAEEYTDAKNIYWAYLKWCKEMDKEPKSRIGFFRDFRKRFFGKSHPFRKVYKVYKASFDLEPEEEQQMLEHLRKEKHGEK